MGQDWPGDRDLVVICELADELGRRFVDRRQTCAELRQRLVLDPLDQMDQDIIEYLNLLFVEPVGIIEKQIGDAPQRFDPLGRRSAFQRTFEFGDKRSRFAQRFSSEDGALYF
jgi:hypothetical protein